MLSAFLMTFILLCPEGDEVCKWYGPGQLKGWETTEVGDPRLCNDAANILNTYPMPYLDQNGHEVMKIIAWCSVPVGGK
jgi:hypothetical protein